MRRVHVLNQYVWPDAAPTSLYAEQLAVRLAENGNDVFLVGGKGKYRTLERPRPAVSLVLLDHFRGRRGSAFQVLAEYREVNHQFRDYIQKKVRAGDTVIVTTAPPNTVWLAPEIRRRGARPIYWLQDYYPELIRGVRDYPLFLRRTVRSLWDRALLEWETVVKVGGNLGGPQQNATVIRNWPTLPFSGKPDVARISKTAIYSGNLGYGHDVALFVATCEKLRSEGYQIDIHADGPGIRRLPSWLKAQPLWEDVNQLQDFLLRSEVHLIAAHPKIQEAVFPSKIWNCLRAGGRITGCGFTDRMQLELEASLSAPYRDHLTQWTDLVGGKATSWNPV